MRVKDIMTTEFRLAGPMMTLRQAAQMMHDGDFGFLPVGENDHLLGAVTDRDIVVRGLAAGADANTQLSEMMSKTIIYCFEDDDIRDAFEFLGECGHIFIF